jgi:hypothetical protein
LRSLIKPNCYRKESLWLHENEANLGPHCLSHWDLIVFPVLARILKESGLIYTKAGATAMGAAAIGDAIAWCVF